MSSFQGHQLAASRSSPDWTATTMATLLLHSYSSNKPFKILNCTSYKAAGISSAPPTYGTPKPETPQNFSAQHTTLLVDSFHQNQSLRALLAKLRRKGSDPLQLLKDEGDWSKQHFWAVMNYLKETFRIKEALQVFDYWKNIENARINEYNYMKLMELLSMEGLMLEAVSALHEMASYGLKPSVKIYNFIIHGYAKKGDFEKAGFFLRKIVQDDLVLDPETYDGLIQAYGEFKMYDEMCKCVKKMESEGCHSDHVTYNILIRAFARGGLLAKMEEVYQTVLSKRMSLQPSTLVAMLDAYADFGILEKMEKFYHKILNSDAYLTEDMVRKIARVYIENYRFSRLEELGLSLACKIGKTDLVWCLLLLSSACVLSRKGMESIIQEMETSEAGLNISCMNIIALALLKMKDSRRLSNLLYQFRSTKIKPDIVAVGVAFDAYEAQLIRYEALEEWRKMGFLKEKAELNTDPLVLTAFGKGFFLKSCEEHYTALGCRTREKKAWTYGDLINLISKQRISPTQARF
ncbi:pentatricopeptide repeat-containing protein At4g14190, chloroplastic [Aristolochia californica]|uniref:pentatricopeptide repeat-containing protein At4g14190, chloroplastic n=1 Tax=Aristolochia californica TaxID=171875 RepID=UPI0035DB7209